MRLGTLAVVWLESALHMAFSRYGTLLGAEQCATPVSTALRHEHSEELRTRTSVLALAIDSYGPRSAHEPEPQSGSGTGVERLRVV